MSGRSHFIESSACPRCRSAGRDRKGDNLANYSDGSSWCFSCSLLTKGTARRPAPVSEEPLEAFSRWTKGLAPSHMENLLKRGFKASELTEFMYDYVWDRRIYPVYSNQELVFYEARSLDKQPKAIQKGEKPLRVLGSGEKLVLVEDLLSAIKTARFTRSAPLWGSSLRKDWIPYIIGMKIPVVVWLDNDKFRTAITIANTLQLVGVDATVVRTDDDPKDLSDTEILKALKLPL